MNEEYITDNIVYSNLKAFREVLQGFPLEKGQSYHKWRVDWSGAFDVNKAPLEGNNGSPRSDQAVLENENNPEEWRCFIYDQEETEKYLETLIENGDANYVSPSDGEVFRPARLDETATLMIVNWGRASQRESRGAYSPKSREIGPIWNRYYVQIVAQEEPATEDSNLFEAAVSLVNAIERKIARKEGSAE